MLIFDDTEVNHETANQQCGPGRRAGRHDDEHDRVRANPQIHADGGRADIRGASSRADVKPGDTVETQTFSAPATTTTRRTPGPWPGEVGPFHIEGAAPGDTLVVRILKLTPNRDVAISNVTPNGISAVAGDSRTRMLNDPLPAAASSGRSIARG